MLLLSAVSEWRFKGWPLPGARRNLMMQGLQKGSPAVLGMPVQELVAMGANTVGAPLLREALEGSDAVQAVQEFLAGMDHPPAWDISQPVMDIPVPERPRISIPHLHPKGHLSQPADLPQLIDACNDPDPTPFWHKFSNCPSAGAAPSLSGDSCERHPLSTSALHASSRCQHAHCTSAAPVVALRLIPSCLPRSRLAASDAAATAYHPVPLAACMGPGRYPMAPPHGHPTRSQRLGHAVQGGRPRGSTITSGVPGRPSKSPGPPAAASFSILGKRQAQPIDIPAAKTVHGPRKKRGLRSCAQVDSIVFQSE